VTGARLLLASGRPLGKLESILASHALIHAAEGEFFRQALRDASQLCSVPISGTREREALQRGSEILRLPVNELENRLAGLGRVLGPPWRQDEKLAALAAWLELVEVES
jgi:phosphoserine phosphatase